jgi:hypothetical protein
VVVEAQDEVAGLIPVPLSPKKEVIMSRRVVSLMVVVAILTLGSWGLAQQAQPIQKKSDVPGGRFAVSPAGTSAVLLDTTTGKTWILHHSVTGTSAAWLPAQQLNTDEEVVKWIGRERDNKKALAMREAQR